MCDFRTQVPFIINEVYITLNIICADKLGSSILPELQYPLDTHGFPSERVSTATIVILARTTNNI